ncbi:MULTISPECIES: hypothetical protein [Campylobacter]|jgi:hypothetical protein|uniref:beta-lactamase n=1 Tax=Campylobacter curvus (strain 525.92) TaxID=360105 RepID=A0A0M4SRP5_CAMC5|nr:MULTISPECIES: hypothetical protein [Campylobacter]ALF45158.1 hypothetical protein CCV52592_0658 [Campylobacter curvus 525.92]EJP75986.1 hypothetical protein HMPREF1139_2104 [Campylobacter sp. FOBRC14]
MKILKFAPILACALSFAFAQGEPQLGDFKFSSAKTGAITRKCDANDAAACYEVAMRYEFGKEGVVRNRLKAQGFFAKACELASGIEKIRACLQNAAALEHFASGQCRSLVIYDELCQNGSNEGCENLARMKREGWHPKEDCGADIRAKFGDGKPQ